MASMWDDVASAWDAVWESTTTGWKVMAAEAEKTYAQLIADDPEAAADQAEAFLAVMAETRADLDRMKAQLPPLPAVTPADQSAWDNYQALEQRYQELMAAFMKDARPVETAMGFIPLVVVAGIALGVGALSWSFAGYEYAVGLREETALASRELDARVEASKEGRDLQDSTLPTPPSDKTPDPLKAASRMGVVLIGGAVAMVAVMFFTRLR